MMSYFIVIGVVLRVLLPAWLMDRLFGDPVSLPHPVIWFGKMIAFGEKRLNKGSYKLWKGGIMSVLLILFVYSVTIGIEYALSFLGTPAVIGFFVVIRPRTTFLSSDTFLSGANPPDLSSSYSRKSASTFSFANT